MLRIILAVVVGFLAWSALWLACNGALTASLPALFQEDGTTDHAGILFTVLALSLVCSLLAGYLAATLAPRAAWKAVGVLAGIQLAVGIAVQTSYWETLPLWYNLLFLAFLVPAHLAGGALRLRRCCGLSPA